MAPKYDIESPAADPLLPAQDESTDGLTCHATPGGGDAAQHVVHGQDIYSQPGVYRGVPDETDDGPSDTKGLVASVATLLFSLPALGVTASAGAKSFSHSISFGFTLAALTNLAQYVAWKTAVRKGTHWQRYGPLYLVGLAVPLVMADLTRHVLQDSGIWSGPSSSMYKPNCGHSERRLGGITCLSLTGWLFTIVFTYVGFACMIAGVFWGADMHIKIRTAWRSLRRSRRRQASQS